MKTGKTKISKNKIYLIILIIALIFTNQSLNTQVKESNSQFIDNIEFLKAKQSQTALQLNQIALEGTIDPEKYFVGPSDRIAINIWISPPVSYNLTVTPEGTLIIPTVGEVKVTDKSLAEVKKIVTIEIRKKYITGEISVTLTEPRPIVVTVSGNVLNPALYTLSSVDRVDKAIQVANQPGVRQTQYDVDNTLERMSTRNIILKRRDGTVHRVDLPKFIAIKDEKYNPYLREGDVIIVPRKNLYKNVIGIYGEVNNPGKFEFVEGDSLLDAIKLGNGLTMLANPDSIEFSRLIPENNHMEIHTISLKEIQNGNGKNIPLQPGDRIVVKPKLELREDFVVYVEGEVKFPGTYPITKNNTKLSDVIRRAGGFTEYASLKSSEVYRRSFSPKEVNLEKLMSMRGNISPEDSSNYLIETELRLQKEIVNVDFEAIFLHNDNNQDLILQDGDYIRISSIRNTVYIFGQVVSPGHIPYTKEKNVEYYISMCGGFTDAARKSDIKIIKNKTKQWLKPDETTIEEGDYIWIPKKPERSFGYYANILSQTASILSVVIGMALVIIQITKK